MTTKITVQRDNARDITFTGERLGKVSSSPSPESGSLYSGSTGSWEVLALYRTESGKLICARVGYTRWQGARDSHQAKVCTHSDEVIEFFGCGWLAKELYAGVDILAQEEVK